MSRIQEYPYAFSVVMAVYNAEAYLREAVDSLIAQDFGFEKVQLILVDDGSRDKSPAICDEYADRYPKNVIVIHKENGGVASARNEGLKYATGRFVNFLDSDDKMSKDAFRKVYRFFCLHEEKTDVVTIPIELFDGAEGPHWQNWKFEKGSRIIDLKKEYDTTVMFVTASFFHARVKDRICFDSRLVVGEDMKVLLTVLAGKMTLGVVADCMFYYRKRKLRTDSLIQTAKKKKGWYTEYFDCLIDWSIEFYTDCMGFLPGFLQYELMYDLQWRISEQYDMDKVLSMEEQLAYKKRLFDTLSILEDKYIIEQKYLEEYQKCYLIEKKNRTRSTPVPTENDIRIRIGETEMEPVSKQPVRIEFLRVNKSMLIIEGIVCIHGLDVDTAQQMPQLQLSAAGRIIDCICSWREIDDRYCINELAQRAMAFCGEINCKSLQLPQTIDFILRYAQTAINMQTIQYGEFAPIGEYRSSYYSKNHLILQPAQRGVKISAKKGSLILHEIRFLSELWSANDEGTRKAVAVRLLYHALKKIKRKPVWLFSDRVMKAGDNGEAFFRYLAERDLKIKRYFLLNNESPDYERISSYGKVVSMLSMQHKMLYLLCDMNISSHADVANFNPFRGHQDGYRDIIADKSFVFLQHGVIKDDLSEWLARSRRNLSGFVTSAQDEYRSILDGRYGYSEKEVWLTGLPRFDYLPWEEKQTRQITIVPTWRESLLPNLDHQTGERLLSDQILESKFLSFYNTLLNHNRLLEAAEIKGYRIVFFPHPNFQNYLDVFKQNEHVSFQGKEKSYREVYAESSLMVTDYSSAVFDFVYMEKPVIYTQFDKKEFFAGEHICKTGYFDYERDGFGEVLYDLESTVDCIIEYMENGCRMKEKYKDRAQRFFAFHDRNNCERVYEKIISME